MLEMGRLYCKELLGRYMPYSRKKMTMEAPQECKGHLSLFGCGCRYTVIIHMFEGGFTYI